MKITVTTVSERISKILENESKYELFRKSNDQTLAKTLHRPPHRLPLTKPQRPQSPHRIRDKPYLL